MLGHRGAGADDDVALLERVAERRELVVGEFVLVGERLDLLLVDETALGGLLEQALGGAEVVQVYGVAQLIPFLSGMAFLAASQAWCVAPTRGSRSAARCRYASL
jgi:hypothetical protein